MREKFKTCISNGRERYWDGQERSVAFPESLLDFLYWDMKKVEADFHKLSVIAQRECATVETILSYLQGITLTMVCCYGVGGTVARVKASSNGCGS